jgi:hypothetical protein
VDDLVPDVDRRTVDLQGALDDLDRPLDAGAEAPGFGKNDAHAGFSIRWFFVGRFYASGYAGARAGLRPQT